MVSAKQMYPSKSNLLVAADFPKPVQTTITAQTVEEDQDGEKGIVLSLKGFEKRLRCNATNARTLAERYGDESEQWVGKEITIASVPTTYQGQNTKGIRVL